MKIKIKLSNLSEVIPHFGVESLTIIEIVGVKTISRVTSKPTISIFAPNFSKTQAAASGITPIIKFCNRRAIAVAFKGTTH